MTILFGALVDMAQTAMNDTAAAFWSEDVMRDFCRQAIRDYSRHLPRLSEQVINLADGVQHYLLEDDCQGVISVEYPRGETPPVYLSQSDHNTPGFFLRAGFYSLLFRQDAVDYNEIWFSDSVHTGQTAEVVYEAMHVVPELDTTAITIPALHYPIVIQFVRYLCYQYALAGEMIAPSSADSTLAEQFNANARDSLAQYHHMIANSRLNISSRIPWRADRHDRIY